MDPAALAALRRSYGLAGLDAADVDPDPVEQFRRWLADAVAAELTEPNAMVLATASPDGRPSARTVLLKGVGPEGFVFFSNYRSRKGRQLAANPTAALLFPWIDLERQVEVVGAVERLPAEASAAYFRSRPHDHQLGSWASRQSEVVASREVLQQRFDELRARYPEGSEVPVPDFWGGFRLVPESIEFWQGGGGRLHDRVRYRRSGPTGWTVERLSP